MLILTRDDLRRALPMDAAMDAVADAVARFSRGQADMPLRSRVAIPPQDGLALFMPAYLGGGESRSGALGVKALTIFPRNEQQYGLPAIAALMLLFDATNGQPLALLDGGSLTALRTGAASGVAARSMARADAHVLALFGAGAQALCQAWAVCVARAIERVWIVNRTRDKAERLAGELRAFGQPVPTDVRVASASREALAEADIVCCATSAPTPVFGDRDLRPGTHVNGIGSYRPDMREVPGETVARARVVVDSRAAAWAEAGDLIGARDEGRIHEEHVVAELGEVVLGQVTGRSDPDQVTFFKSVGIAVQDVAAAHAAYQRASTLGIGTQVAM